MMEFRFAATQLRLPLVIAAVGTGNTWETTEVFTHSPSLSELSFTSHCCMEKKSYWVVCDGRRLLQMIVYF